MFQLMSYVISIHIHYFIERGSFQVLCLWWQHHAFLHMTELKKCLWCQWLSQRCTVLV